MSPNKIKTAKENAERVVLRGPGGTKWQTRVSPRLPGVLDAAAKDATNTVQRVVGFWFCYHALGRESGLYEAGWPKETVLRNQRDFRAVFGVPVWEWAPDGRELDGLMAALGFDRAEQLALPGQ